MSISWRVGTLFDGVARKKSHSSPHSQRLPVFQLPRTHRSQYKKHKKKKKKKSKYSKTSYSSSTGGSHSTASHATGGHYSGGGVGGGGDDGSSSSSSSSDDDGDMMDVRELEAHFVGTTLYLNFTAFSFR